MKKKLLKIYFNFFGYLAKKYQKKYKPFVIGVTGSVGKTSCRMIIYDTLKKCFKEDVYTSNKNFNGELGMSLSLLGIEEYKPSFFGVINVIFKSFFIAFFSKQKYKIIILEYGIDHIGEMDFLLSICTPEIGIVTKLDKVHSSQFKNTTITASEKYKLLQKTKNICFFNFLDAYSKKYYPFINTEKYFYSTGDQENNDIDIKGLNEKLLYENSKINLRFSLFFKEDFKSIIHANLIGKENIGYISIAFFILDYLEKKFNKNTFCINNKEIYIDYILQYSRFSIFNGIKDSILVDSTYNAAPESMKKVINNFLTLKQKVFNDYEIILCLGEMRELLDYEKEEHEKLADFVKNITENIFVVGESMKKYFCKKCIKAKYFANSKILGDYLFEFINNSEKKYILLFKGSQNTIFMEESLIALLKDKNDVKNICRQEDFWKNIKNNFFNKK